MTFTTYRFVPSSKLSSWIYSNGELHDWIPIVVPSGYDVSVEIIGHCP